MPKRKSSELVQITPSPIPPLRQSTISTMSCPLMYAEIFVKGNKPPSGLDAARGTEIHKTMAEYLSHCARKQVGMDLYAFEKFSHGAGTQAYKILSGLRDGYIVDHQHLFATEISMALDEYFRPTDIAKVMEGVVKSSGLPAVYQGTLDGFYVFREESKIVISDFKSHIKPYDPSDPKYKAQGDEYATFILIHFPWVQTVVFRLTFVRYKNLHRESIYTREDLPKLIEGLKAARERQKLIHQKFDNGEEIEAISNDNCIYCPLLSNLKCPIASFNPMMQLSPEEWVKFDLFYSAFSKVNRARMKALVQGTGKNITLRDYNGKAYVYGPNETESSVYPLFHGTGKSIATRCDCGGVFDYVPEDGLCPTCQDRKVVPILPIVDELMSYAEGNVKDTDWFGKLVISSTELNSKLGAKKRSFLDQSVQDKADKVPKVKMKVSKPLDSLPEEFDEDGDNEFDEEF